MQFEKYVLLRVTQDGAEIIDASFDPPSEARDREQSLPSEDDIGQPQWTHWRNRALAKIWQATMLGLNIEPTVAARHALKKFRPAAYQDYVNRLDIAKARYGYDLTQYEDHMLAGDRPGEKYVELNDYCQFATQFKWTGIDKMKIGLASGSAPPLPVDIRQRKLNNMLVLLHEVLNQTVKDFNVHEPFLTANSILQWLQVNELRTPVSDQTLASYVKEMKDAIKNFDQLQSRKSVEAE